MSTEVNKSFLNIDVDAALLKMTEETATATGQEYFDLLVRNLSEILGVYGAWVTEYLPKEERLRALSFWVNGEYVRGYEYDIHGTPCEHVVKDAQILHLEDNIYERYPKELDLRQYGGVSFLGAPAVAHDGTVMGHLSIFDNRPMPAEPRALALFKIFTDRAAAELQRLRNERMLREREEKLGRLVDSTMDAIIELDPQLNISLLNPAAREAFCPDGGDIAGECFTKFVADDDRTRLMELISEIDTKSKGRRSLWIPGGLRISCPNGDQFHAEATLSRYEVNGEPYHTLVLRNVNERIEAERRIESLTEQAAYLRDEINALHNYDDMVGNSERFIRMLADIKRVSATTATVLILGETGTGKELIARSIHAGSKRADRPLIKVNCAAIPATLIESEFFGHERGAFTGATQKRDGRFALADGGTIFLDEVAELPLDLQSKLLRVLQEGEFEPVGSSKTVKVDVRIIAATNRDLEREVKDGNFRADLFYRLNVFPIKVPPLRKRGDDVILLARHFAERFARQVGRSVPQLTAFCIEQLKGYHWPGNIRELENVVERAMIGSTGEFLNVTDAMPVAGSRSEMSSVPTRTSGVMTAEELQDMERDNIVRALESAGWKVAGDNGAARMLNLSPSTLSSRMKALGIKRPNR